MKEHDEALKTYEQGLSFDKDNQELRDGLLRCQQALNKVSHGLKELLKPSIVILGLHASGMLSQQGIRNLLH